MDFTYTEILELNYKVLDFFYLMTVNESFCHIIKKYIEENSEIFESYILECENFLGLQ